MDLITLVRTSYIVAATTILAVQAIPFFRNRFLAYGSRSSPITSPGKQNESPNAQVKGYIGFAFDGIAGLRVPHSWFASFYIVSVSLSLFWATQLVLKWPFFRLLVSLIHHSGPSMTLHQVLVTWLMMLLQGSRRLSESFLVMRPSVSQMWVGHWALGVWFYLTMSISVWIEGTPALLKDDFGTSHIIFTLPTIRTIIATLLFILASGVQHDCHTYLASLKKYTLPEHPIFQQVVCPHYFAECLIYLSLAIVSAPAGDVLNKTVFCALIFVAVNLGVTAAGTKKWYETKFGKQALAARSKMIPFVY